MGSVSDTGSETSASAPPPFARLLATMLPEAGQTHLLRACLHEGDRARAAWQQYAAARPVRPTAGQSVSRDQKVLSPLLCDALEKNGLPLSAFMRTWVRSASLREEARYATWRAILEEVVEALAEYDGHVLFLGGTALAHSVWPRPALRHSHGLELWVPETEAADGSLQDLRRRLGRVGFQPVSPGANRPTSADAAQPPWQFRHTSDLALTMRRRPFAIPHYSMDFATVWQRRRSILLGQRTFDALGPADQLVHTCVEACCTWHRESLNWACDAWYLLAAADDLPWRSLLQTAEAWHASLALWITFGYLREELDAPIPAFVMAELTQRARQSTADDRLAALVGARQGRRGGARLLLRGAADLSEWVSIARQLLLPSPRYFRWTVADHRPTLLPYYYVRHGLRPWLVRGRGMLKRTLAPLAQRGGRTSRGAA
ncbi:MAG: hypothetical protein DWQ31_14515 [Planctomycetota bacterium]|nr:MAG: hypothetical protein DWQ31_14515 [Planctomycetota bacterium]REJ94158.1 MAG: hypothetical protein DWQ35_09075 [Planctomycetota bacterium]